MPKKIYVTKVLTEDFVECWDKLKNGAPPKYHYLLCNSAGVIDWSKTHAFTPDELIDRNGYILVERYEPMTLKTPLFEADEKL